VHIHFLICLTRWNYYIKRDEVFVVGHSLGGYFKNSVSLFTTKPCCIWK